MNEHSVTVVNIKAVGRQSGAIYIGRSMPGFAASVLGNPHKAGHCPRCGCTHTREQALELYRDWLRSEYRKGGVVRQELERLADLSETQDLVLACWCKPLSCHGDVVKDAIAGIVKKRTEATG